MKHCPRRRCKRFDCFLKS